ncbi:MAG TPA: hypothetical protein VFM05_11400, partial [Candidatus Saccharimonadales bacterium]|nr:hypothetical protein [Candidatus Saccharimonadales bacterium]
MRRFIFLIATLLLGTGLALTIDWDAVSSKVSQGTPAEQLIHVERQYLDDTRTREIAPPKVSLIGMATIANLCEAAIIVSIYGADNPAERREWLQGYCVRADEARNRRETPGCISALSKLAQAAHGYSN